MDIANSPPTAFWLHGVITSNKNFRCPTLCWSRSLTRHSLTSRERLWITTVGMPWSWVIFLTVILAFNYLSLGAQLIGTANFLGVLLCGEQATQQGKGHPLLGIAVSLICQVAVATTMAALIIAWARSITNGGQIIYWIIGGVSAVYPIWQAFRLSNYERVYEPESYIAKGPTSLVLLVSLPLTIIATILFIIYPAFCRSVLYFLLPTTFLLMIIAVICFLSHYHREKQPRAL